MKFFLVIAIFALIAGVFAEHPELSDEEKAGVKKHEEHCKKEVKISEEEIDKLRKKDFSSPTDAQKCFSRCFFIQAGSLKDDVVQDVVVLKELVPKIGEKKTKELMANCNGLKGDDSCDTALKVFECYEKGNAGIAF